jgi:ketosteroid isomerase-like protein
MIPLPDQVRRSYTALMTGDHATAREHCAEDVTCHIGGQHPFTGDYHGVAQITDVVRCMDEVGGAPSFTVTNVMSDDSGSQVLIEGVAVHGSYARHVINRLRYEGGRLTELWIRPLDQRAEDEFWRGRVPQQRAGGSGAPADAEATNGG